MDGFKKDPFMNPEDFRLLKTELFSKENQNVLSEEALSTEINTVLSETSSKKILNENLFLKLFSPEERYELLKTLGEGGMGVVQLVQDRVLQRSVALKKIKMIGFHEVPISETQQILLWRLYREAMITASLEHPNIVPIYEMQQVNTQEICFTMRKIEGQTFRELLKKKRDHSIVLEESKRLLIFQKICDAVAYAHSKGVIHRDLKPDNIMIGAFGEVYVMDWGLAKKQGETQEILPTLESSFGNYQTIGGMGTLGYMPPEQKENAALVTPQSDIYALGKILEECFTEIPPYEKVNDSSTWIPLDIQAIVRKATKEHPQERYATIQEMARDLEHYMNHSRVSVREYKLSELFQKWARRNKKRLSFTGVLFGLAFGIGLFFHWKEFYKREQSFQTYWRQAFVLKQRADLLHPQNRNERYEKMQHLISALNALNKALFLKPQHPEAEQEKYQIAQKLLDLCYQLQDYPLARYVVSDLQEIASLKLTVKQALKDRVQEEQSKILIRHQERLHFWITELQKTALEKGMRENAIFEISKMTEPEIVEQIQEKIREGTRYLLSKDSSRERNIRLDELYQTLVLGLGRQENPKSAVFFLQELRVIAEVLTKIPSGKRSNSVVQQMICLAQGLAFSKAEGFSQSLMEIRKSMGLEDLFSYATALPYKNLVILDLPRYQQPKNENEFHERGLMKKALEDYEGALEDFTQAINRTSKPASLSVLHNARGSIRYEQGLFREAIEDFTQAIQYHSENDLAYGNRAMTLYLLKEFEQAEQNYEQAIKLNPNYFLHYRNRGMLKKELLRFEESLQDYDRAIQLNPQDIPSYTNRGSVKYLQKDFEGALNDFNQALTLNPGQAEVYMNRAAVHRSKGHLTEAISDYNQAILLNPQDFKAYYNRGFIRYLQKDVESALQEMQQVIRLNPKFARAYVLCADIKRASNDLKGALENYNQAILLEPMLEGVFLSRGRLKYQMNDFEGALNDYIQAIQQDPKNAKICLQGGIIAKQLKDYERAILFLQQAIDLDPTEISAYAALGDSALENKQFALAVQSYTQLLDQQPSHREVIETLATILFHEIIRLYRENRFIDAKNAALLFQKYIPKEHGKREKVDQMLHKIETLIK